MRTPMRTQRWWISGLAGVGLLMGLAHPAASQPTSSQAAAPEPAHTQTATPDPSGASLPWQDPVRIQASFRRASDALGDRLIPAWQRWSQQFPELDRLGRIATSPRGAAGLGALALALGTGILIARRLRGTGGIALHLEFPGAIEGEFEVRISRKSLIRTSSRKRAGWRGTTRVPARHIRRGVQRETQFGRLAPGAWFIAVEGTLVAPKSRALLAKVVEEIEVTIEAKETPGVSLAIPAPETPVEFRIHWDRQPARDIGLALQGVPESLRYSSQGVARTTLPLGQHGILIGSGDRVVRRPTQIADFEPCTVAVDLAESKGLVFKGCPPAVQAYLQGDLGQAARALERDGQADTAHLLLAELHQERGQTERAAEQLENAGRIREAAELRQAISDFGRAGALFEAVGDLDRAAEMYDAAEAWDEAAATYSAIQDWGKAARCFEAAGNQTGLIGALEASGELVRAAALATELDDRARAIQLLQQVGPQHSDHGRAGELLALAFEEEGHLDLAAGQLERRLAQLTPGESAPQLELHLAELYDEIGDAARALAVLEALRDREPTYPEIAGRIEGLRKKISAAAQDSQAAAFTTPPGATAFVAKERYEILEEIGRGGMGLVYKALDRRLGREVALKRMPESLRDHSAALSLFLGEAQAAARMNHPNIVTLYDADQSEGSFFITMELLDGLPLNAILAERGPFSPRDTARLGIQICAGLQFAHDQGIVHRDIKTANLFITRDRVLKIMDFGLAKVMAAVRAGSTVIAGTPYYMAPEQSAGGTTDPRTDLYSLGVTLFELSTGELPFSEGDLSEQHRHAQPPNPSSLIEGYSQGLARLILRLLAKSPDERPGSAAEVSDILNELIDSGTT